MGDIKDAYDLMEKLILSIKDRKILARLAPIQDKIHKSASENLALERENFRLERQHAEEMDNLKLSHSNEVSDLRRQISTLEAALEKLKTKPSPPQPIVTKWGRG